MQVQSLVRAAASLALLSPSLPTAAAEAAHAVELEEVVVTASPIGQADRLATIAGSVDRGQLVRGGSHSMADALAQLPGVSSSGFAAGAGRPVIRGMDANRVRMLEDGIGSFDVSDVGPDHGVPMEPLAAERVEVVRGAATLRYGSQAIGGVVNAISRRVPLQLADGALGGEILAGFGSVADGRDLAARIDARRGALAVHADATHRDADDYRTPDGTVPNSWLRTRSGALGSAYVGDRHRLGLAAVRSESRYGIPAEDTFIDMQQTKLLLRSAWSLPGVLWRQVSFDAGWADYTHSERDEVETHATFDDEEWDVRAEAVAGAFGWFSEFAIGAQAQRKDFAALGDGGGYLAPTRTDHRALFSFAEHRLAERARLQFGARLEDVAIAGTAAAGSSVARSFTPLSVSAGLLLEASSRSRLGLALSSAARAPAQTELFARGAHEATATYETGDPRLRRERATSAELTLRWRGARVHADGALWLTDFDDYILGALTGRSCNESGACIPGDAEGLRELLYGQQGARFHGAEGHAEIELLQRAAGDLHLELTGDVVRARLDDGAGNVPRIPPWRAGIGLSWQAEHVEARVFWRYSGRQRRVGAGDTPTGGFANLDAEFTWRAAPRGIELAFVGRNLADTRQRNAVAFNKDEVMLPGRDLRLVLRAMLD